MTDNICVFDVETTGLPPNSSRMVGTHNIRAWNGCRIVQIAWAIYSPNGTLLKDYVTLVKPDGFLIPKSSTEIHGVTTEMAEADGIPMVDVLNQFSLDMDTWNVKSLVAHNISFDRNVLYAEALRYGFPLELPEDLICTMMVAAQHHPTRKWLKLGVLYEDFFGETVEGAHRADCDVAACSRIFFECKRRGWCA